MELNKLASTKVKIADIIQRRWSPRAFDKDYSLSKQELLALCEAVRWAPSCFGDEPWRVIICDKASNQDAFKKALNCMVEWNQNWAKNSSTIFIFLSSKYFRKNGNENSWAEYDTGAAAENLCLQAVDLGLAAHQIGGFDYEKTKSEFDIPDEFKIMSFIAIGKQAEPVILDEELKKLELAPRKRNPIKNNFFDGDLNKAFD